jgi:RND superfamily putative drug exporter
MSTSAARPEACLTPAPGARSESDDLLLDSLRAVRHCLAITGRTITSAACIQIVVFAAFIDTTDSNIKMIGLGMTIAIALDSLIVRTMLVPAIVHTLGRANWYLPPGLERCPPHLDLDDDIGTAAPPERELVSVES